LNRAGLVAFLTFVGFSSLSFAQNPQDCAKVPDYNKLKAALTSAVKEGKGANGVLSEQQRTGPQRWNTSESHPATQSPLQAPRHSGYLCE
jgi:hypothetical protein